MRKFFQLYLVFLVVFFAGYFSHKQEYWPHSLVHQVTEFLDPEGVDRKLSIKDKLINDFGGTPKRSIVTNEKSINIDMELYRELEIEGLSKDRQPPLVYLSSDAPRGYRLLYGSFMFEDKLHGAILLNPDGQVENIWKVSVQNIDAQISQSDANIYPHGVAVLPDGSAFFNFDGDLGFLKYDYCGNVLWSRRIPSHHTISLDVNRGIGWLTAGAGVEKFDLETGAKALFIHDRKIHTSNPGLDIFGARRHDDVGEKLDWKMVYDALHINDVEPLTAVLADKFPQFSEGDLLISMRNANLIFVIDPVTLKIKWWRSGGWERQHDPDWAADGTISIFDNQMYSEYSRILKIDPVTYDIKTVVDGKRYGFHSPTRGKHQILPNANVLIASPRQGRAFEVDREGKIAFDFINQFDEPKKVLTGGHIAKLQQENLHVSEAIWLPEDYFTDLPKCDE